MDDAEKRARDWILAHQADSIEEATAALLDRERQAEARGAERAYEKAADAIASIFAYDKTRLFALVDRLSALARAEKARGK